MWSVLFAILVILGFAGLWTAIQSVKKDAMRVRYLESELKGLREDYRRDLALLREHMALVAEGNAPAAESIREGLSYTNLSPEDAQKLVDEGDNVVVMDVRTSAEFEEGHIVGAVHTPINELPKLRKKLPATDRTLLVYCASGARSTAACEYLSQEGYGRLYHLPTGFASWPGSTEKGTESKKSSKEKA